MRVDISHTMMTKKKIWFLLFIIAIMMFSTCVAVAADMQTLRIGTQLLPPYGAVDGRGHKWGLLYELNQKLGKRSGMAFSNELYPYPRMIEMLACGKLDAISSQPHDLALAAGDKLAVQFEIDVIAVPRKGAGVKTLEDFRDREVVYHQGAAYAELDALPAAIHRVSDYSSVLKMLFRWENLAGGVFSEPAYYYHLHELGLSPKDFGAAIMVSPGRKQWVFVRKDMPAAMRERLAKAVNEIHAEGMYQRLLKELREMSDQDH